MMATTSNLVLQLKEILEELVEICNRLAREKIQDPLSCYFLRS